MHGTGFCWHCGVTTATKKCEGWCFHFLGTHERCATCGTAINPEQYLSASVWRREQQRLRGEEVEEVTFYDGVDFVELVEEEEPLFVDVPTPSISVKAIVRRVHLR